MMIAKLDYESGGIFQERGKNDDAMHYFDQAKAEFARLQKEQPESREVMLAAADNDDLLGDLLRHEGKIDEAFDEYSAAKVKRDHATSQGNGKVTDEVLALSTSHLKLGSIYFSRGESQLALDEYKASLHLRETVLESQPDNVDVQKKVLDVEEQLAQLESQLGDDKAAVETFRRALPFTQQLQRRDPTNTEWQYQRGNLLADLGFALIDSGEFKDGVANIEAAIGVQKDLVMRDPKSTRYQIALSRSFTRDGDAHLYVGETDEGINQYRAALDLRKELVAKDAQSVAYAKLANAFVLKADPGRAQDAHEQALAIRRQLVIDSPANGAFKDELASTEIELGKLVAVRDAKAGGELINAGLAQARSLVTSDPLNLDWKETFVRGLIAQARVARVASDTKTAQAALDEALATAEEAVHRSPQNVHWPGTLAEAHAGLAELATAAGNSHLAIGEWKKARDILEPLAKAGRLPAPRISLLDRARAQR